jgi:hypothetical protein
MVIGKIINIYRIDGKSLTVFTTQNKVIMGISEDMIINIRSIKCGLFKKISTVEITHDELINLSIGIPTHGKKKEKYIYAPIIDFDPSRWIHISMTFSNSLTSTECKLVDQWYNKINPSITNILHDFQLAAQSA